LGIVNMDTLQSLPDSYPGGKDAEMHSEDVMPGTGYLYAYGSKINKIIVMNIQPMLAYGSVGPYVVQLQKDLREEGISPGPSDGIFGPKTLQAVRKFQQVHGLIMDGIFGPQTWGALLQ
jgi:peptidoglycan hydrolase-like protein with peptidoglycan-binding domain